MPRLRYVVPGNTPGGNGTTTDITGANRGYSTQNEAEAAEQGDLTTMEGFQLRCLKGTVADTTNVVYAGWTGNSSTYYIEVIAWGDGVHEGTVGSGYAIECSSGHCIEVQEEYTRIGDFGAGLSIINTSTGSSDEGIRFNLSNSDLLECYAIGNIIQSTTATSSKDGIYLAPGAASQSMTLYAFCNVIYGWNRAGIHPQNYVGAGDYIVNAINNTLHGNGTDIEGRANSNTTVVNSFNNILASLESFGSGGGSPVFNGSNNVTKDAKFNTGNMTAGAQATDGVTTTSKTTGAWIVFKNTTPGSEDYGLLDDEAGNLPVAFGADKTADVPTDILGNTYATTPDNGAFELGATQPVHTASGIVVSQTSTIAGTATKTIKPSAAIASQSANIAGTAVKTIEASANIQSQSAVIVGTADASTETSVSGVVASQDATVVGSFELTKIASAIIQSQSALVVGSMSAYSILSASGIVVSQSANVSGNAIDPGAFTPPAQVENIMTAILNRAAYTSASAASPYTTAIVSGATAAPIGIRAFFMIEQADNSAIWANVQGNFSTTTNFIINSIEETSESDNSVPTFVGGVNIFSSLPIKQMSDSQEDGRDAVLIIGGEGAVGNNGAALTTEGWNEVLDTVDSNVLVYNVGTKTVNAAHTAEVVNAELQNKYHIASNPLPHGGSTLTEFPEENSVGFGIELAKEYFHKSHWSRQTVILPAGKILASAFTTGEWTNTSGAMYTASVNLVNTFLAENATNKVAMIVISLGLQDSTAGANAAFEAALDALIAKFRNDAFTGNTLQSDFARLPIVVCGLPDDFVTATGAAATAIEAILADTPNRLRNTAFANQGAYTTDTSSEFIDAVGQRDFAKVIYQAYTNTFANVVVT